MYICKTLIDNQCTEWVVYESILLDTLAITLEDAQLITLAIVSLMLLAFVGGLIGKQMLNN